MSLLADTRDLIESQAALHDACIVALDGKDSMVVLDLVRPIFKRVEAFNMVYAFGTQRFKDKAAYVRSRWQIDLKEVEHFGAIDHANRGMWCVPRAVAGPRRMRDAYEQQKQEYGIGLVATGSRMSESLGRRQCIERGTWPGWHPIAAWRKSDVLNYMQHNNIPLPDKDKDMQGTSLHRSCVLEIYRDRRGDYELLKEKFPLLEAIIKREQWYGS